MDVKKKSTSTKNLNYISMSADYDTTVCQDALQGPTIAAWSTSEYEDIKAQLEITDEAKHIKLKHWGAQNSQYELQSNQDN